jgi:hypothetical protein
MAVQTITLPAGTNVTKHINLPTCGNWLGLVRLSLSTFGANATVHSWLIIYPNNPDNKIRWRRTGGTVSNDFKNWTLTKDTRVVRWLVQNETMTTINYTSTNDISLCIETTRTVTPSAYPSIPASSGEANEIQMPGDPLNGMVYWTAA